MAVYFARFRVDGKIRSVTVEKKRWKDAKRKMLQRFKKDSKIKLIEYKIIKMSQDEKVDKKGEILVVENKGKCED
jgi:hypothetical protein